MPETPEQEARRVIDAQLVAAGWVVQALDQINLSAARGVAVREMQSEGGPADYGLFVDGKALGVLEAKKAGTTLSGVAEQSQRYTAAKKWIPQRWADPLPFTYDQIHWLNVIKNYDALNGAFATGDQTAYLEIWQSVDSIEGVPLAVA